MELSRRHFLGGALALTAAAVVAPSFTVLPRIVGDGVYDDAPGLNAFLRGEAVAIEAEGVKFSEGFHFVEDCTFRLSSTLVVPKGIKLVCTHCSFTTPHENAQVAVIA